MFCMFKWFSLIALKKRAPRPLTGSPGKSPGNKLKTPSPFMASGTPAPAVMPLPAGPCHAGRAAMMMRSHARTSMHEGARAHAGTRRTGRMPHERPARTRPHGRHVRSSGARTHGSHAWAARARRRAHVRTAWTHSWSHPRAARARRRSIAGTPRKWPGMPVARPRRRRTIGMARRRRRTVSRARRRRHGAVIAWRRRGWLHIRGRGFIVFRAVTAISIAGVCLHANGSVHDLQGSFHAVQRAVQGFHLLNAAPKGQSQQRGKQKSLQHNFPPSLRPGIAKAQPFTAHHGALCLFFRSVKQQPLK